MAIKINSDMVPGIQRRALQLFPGTETAVVAALSPGRDVSRDSLRSPTPASTGVIFTSLDQRVDVCVSVHTAVCSFF